MCSTLQIGSSRWQIVVAHSTAPWCATREQLHPPSLPAPPCRAGGRRLLQAPPAGSSASAQAIAQALSSGGNATAVAQAIAQANNGTAVASEWVGFGFRMNQ